MEIRLPYQWAPRAYQKPLWRYLRNGGKRAVACWPRRHGKDDMGLQHTACSMGQRKGVYWYLLPEYAQARKAVWDAIDEEKGVRRIDLVFPKQIRNVYSEQEMKIGYGGSYLQIVGADNYNSLVGTPPVGVGFSEYARTQPSAWAYIMPIIEKNGGWAYFNSTPYGDNHFKRFCEFAETQMQAGKDWFYQRLTADECGVYRAEQLEAIKDELCTIHGSDYGMALFLQEYYTAFDAAIPGSYFAEFIDKAKNEGRIYPFAVDRKVPVFTGWDLGRTDDTAIWWYQIIHGELMVFDFHSSSLKDVDFYADLLEQKRDQHGIRYGRHWLPHDARPRTQAAGAGSILQQFAEHARRNPKLGSFAIAKRLDKQEQIQAVRKTLPRCRFHDTRTEEGVKALRHYHREWDEDRRKFNDTPYHDWCFSKGAQVLTPIGWRAIENLSVHDHVLTPLGSRAILRAGIVRRTDQWTTLRGIRCTPEHRFFTSRGLVEADDVSSHDVLWTRGSWGLQCLAWWCVILRFGFMDAITWATPEESEARKRPCSSIGWCMRLCMVRFRQTMRFIIETAIRGITTLTTWSPFRAPSIDHPINQNLAFSAAASSAGPSSAATRSLGKPVRRSVGGTGRPALSVSDEQSGEHDEPAYSLTVNRDHCYFVRGDDGRAYLVANSSHPCDAMMVVAVTWKIALENGETPDHGIQVKAPTWGEIMKQHLQKMSRKREEVA